MHYIYTYKKHAVCQNHYTTKIIRYNTLTEETFTGRKIHEFCKSVQNALVIYSNETS